MRILYITTIGSTMGFFHSLIRELLDLGHTVDIATNETNCEKKIPECYRQWGCNVYQISCSRSPLNKGNVSAIKEIKQIVKSGNYDIVHCHTPIAAACTRIACRKLRKNGIKVIYTAHGFHFYTGAPLKNWLLYYPIEWICAFWTDILITINKEDYERAKKHMHAKQIEYVPGVGIDTKGFMNTKVDRAAKRREIEVSDDAFLLLSVGELNENKNHSVVIKAIAKLNNPNIHYAIAGIGPLKDYLQSLADSLGVDENLHLLGYRKDVAELYKALDLCVFPSIREGLPVSVMEGMAAGLPFVAADNRGTRDLLKNGDNGIICRHDDVDAFAEAIQILSNDKELCIKMGTLNQEKSRAFDYAIVNKQMKQIYGVI